MFRETAKEGKQSHSHSSLYSNKEGSPEDFQFDYFIATATYGVSQPMDGNSNQGHQRDCQFDYCPATASYDVIESMDSSSRKDHHREMTTKDELRKSVMETSWKQDYGKERSGQEHNFQSIKEHKRRDEKDRMEQETRRQQGLMTPFQMAFGQRKEMADEEISKEFFRNIFKKKEKDTLHTEIERFTSGRVNSDSEDEDSDQDNWHSAQVQADCNSIVCTSKYKGAQSKIGPLFRHASKKIICQYCEDLYTAQMTKEIRGKGEQCQKTAEECQNNQFAITRERGKPLKCTAHLLQYFHTEIGIEKKMFAMVPLHNPDFLNLDNVTDRVLLVKTKKSEDLRLFISDKIGSGINGTIYSCLRNGKPACIKLYSDRDEWENEKKYIKHNGAPTFIDTIEGKDYFGTTMNITPYFEGVDDPALSFHIRGKDYKIHEKVQGLGLWDYTWKAEEGTEKAAYLDRNIHYKHADGSPAEQVKGMPSHVDFVKTIHEAIHDIYKMDANKKKRYKGIYYLNPRPSQPTKNVIMKKINRLIPATENTVNLLSFGTDHWGHVPNELLLTEIKKYYSDVQKIIIEDVAQQDAGTSFCFYHCIGNIMLLLANKSPNKYKIDYRAVWSLFRQCHDDKKSLPKDAMVIANRIIERRRHADEIKQNTEYIVPKDTHAAADVKRSEGKGSQ